MSRTTLDGLRAAVGDRMQELQSTVDAYDEAAAAVLGVNRTDLRCLEILLQRDEVTPGILGRALGLTTGSVTTMLDRLEKPGHLRRSPDPADRRKTVVRITDATKRKLWDLYGPFATEGDGILDDYTTEDLQLLAAYLRRSRDLYLRHLARVRDLPAAPRP